MVIVRSDGGGDFRGEKFGDLCRSRGIKQEFTTVYSPQFNGVTERALGFNGVAEHALGLIETATMNGGPNPGSRDFCGAQIPPTASLWAKASHWARGALNRTATTANPESNSPREMWHGSSPPVVLLPFLKPGSSELRGKTSHRRNHRSVFTLALHPTAP